MVEVSLLRRSATGKPGRYCNRPMKVSMYSLKPTQNGGTFGPPHIGGGSNSLTAITPFYPKAPFVIFRHDLVPFSVDVATRKLRRSPGKSIAGKQVAIT